MRHRKSFNHLSRKSAHRKAMLANMASSLILHKRIHTTTAKAKALKRYIEPLITRSREDSTHSRRMVFSYLHDKEAVSELFREVAVKVGERPGGYTRIIRIGSRQGDNADMCMMELVDYNPTMLAEKEASVKPSRRRRGGRGRGGKKAEPAAAEQQVREAGEQAVEEQAPAVEQAPEAAEKAPAEAPAAEKEKSAEEAEKPAAEAKEQKAEEPKAEAKEQKAEKPAAEAEETKAEEPKAEAGSGEPEAAGDKKSGENEDESQAGEEEKKDQ
ncbi:MAG: 50S ribosomal protein L17 [Bacteroidales bacterium]